MFSAMRSTGIILLFGADGRRESRTKAMQAMAACLQACNKRLTAAGLYRT